MTAFVVVCSFQPGTVMDEVFAVVAEEQAKVKELQDQGLLGEVKLSMARGTVFLDVFGDSPASAASTVAQLPMAKWWDLDIYPLGGGA